MLEHLFSKSVPEWLYAGPLGSYVNSFTSLLLEKGYTNYSIKVKIRLVAKFSRWLNQQNLGFDDLKLELFVSFLFKKKPSAGSDGLAVGVHPLLQLSQLLK